MTEPDRRLRESELRLLAAGLAAILLPVAMVLPPWVMGFAVLFVAWRLIAGWRGLRHTPLGWLRVPLGVAGFVGIYAQFGTFNGVAPGTALLTLMLGLKFMESWRPRDALVLNRLGFILMLAVFLSSQTLPVAVWLILAGWFQVMLMLRLARLGTPEPISADLKHSGGLLLQALPVALILFVLFPRVPGPLWGTPTPEDQALTGLSDSMAPGRISELAQSNALAFRVRFTGSRQPARDELYWRGPVFHEFDGQEWREGPTPPRRPELIRQGEPVEQEITLEPHGQDWLLALDIPGQPLPNDSRQRPDMRLEADDSVNERQRYEVRSWPDYTLAPELPQAWQERLTRLPEDFNPRTRDLAEEWRSATDGDGEALIRRAMTHFREKPFYYTLQPPTLGRHAMDEFLFETRRGFCEHYAAAFTILMRAAGLPSRVVTGYAGAEFNPLAGHYRVLQSNAHAWSEVWLPGDGWVRVDPTTAIPPGRMETDVGARGNGDEDGSAGGWSLERLGLQMEMAWDAVQARWDAWVLAYGPDTQQAFLERLGLPSKDAMKLAGIMVVLIGLTMLAIWFGLSLNQRPARSRDPVERLWQVFQRRMARAGLERHAAEGPAAWLERLRQERPAVGEQIAPLIKRFRSARYAGNDSHLDRIRTQVKRLSTTRLRKLKKLPSDEKEEPPIRNS